MTDNGWEGSSRIAYWRESMERARGFMDRMMEYPVIESRDALCSIPEAAQAAGVEVRFSDTPIVDDIPRIFEVREGVIGPLLEAAAEMLERGWILKIEDGFRTAEMQRKLARKEAIFDAILRKTVWELGSEDPEAEIVFRRVSVLVATVPKLAGHMSGCAVDISVLDRDTQEPLERGGPYLEMSELTPMFSPFISPVALINRSEITAVMERFGFAAYPFEFCHYSLGVAFAEDLRHTGIPACYGAVHRNPIDGSIDPIDDLAIPLHDAQDILDEIRSAKQRLQ